MLIVRGLGPAMTPLVTLGQSCMRRRVDYVTWMTDLAFEKLFLDLLSRGSALSQG